MTVGCTKTVFAICLIALFLTAIIAIGIIMRTAFPFLKHNSSGNGNNSLIFFGSVSAQSYDEFSENYQQQGCDSLLEDYKSQVYTLAGGLTEKYKNLRRASFCVFLEVLLIITAFVLLLTNHLNANF
jgi:hypothetical protein